MQQFEVPASELQVGDQFNDDGKWYRVFSIERKGNDVTIGYGMASLEVTADANCPIEVRR